MTCASIILYATMNVVRVRMKTYHLAAVGGRTDDALREVYTMCRAHQTGLTHDMNST